MSSLSVRDIQGLSAFNNEVRIASGSSLSIEGNFKVPTWTTANRPATPSNGILGFNSTNNALDVYSNSTWRSIGQPSGLYTRLSTPTIWSASFTGQTSGAITASSQFSIPSTARAIYATGYYHVTGYSSGWNDHAISHFGQNTIPGWSAWSFNTTTNYKGSYVLYHDGDSSGSPHYYGFWTNGGIININDNGSIYYELGNGYSGGTHYNQLWCWGYWS